MNLVLTSVFEPGGVSQFKLQVVCIYLCDRHVAILSHGRSHRHGRTPSLPWTTKAPQINTQTLIPRFTTFGRHCSLRAFQEMPQVIQCRNCYWLGVQLLREENYRGQTRRVTTEDAKWMLYKGVQGKYFTNTTRRTESSCQWASDSTWSSFTTVTNLNTLLYQMTLPRSNYDPRRVCLNPGPFPEITLGKHRRTMGVYLAGALVGLGLIKSESPQYAITYV